MIKIIAICMIVAATAGTCEKCGKAVDEAVNGAKTKIVELQTAGATYVPTQAPARGSSYLAIGDSVPAGADIAPLCSTGSCGDKGQAYPAGVAALASESYDSSLASSNVACSGATPQQAWEGGGGCAEQRSALEAHHSWVTITISADELLNAAKKPENLHCLVKEDKELNGDERRICEGIVNDALNNASTYIAYLIQDTAKHADVVVVTGYYHIFANAESGKITDRLNKYVDRMNKMIKGNVACCGLTNIYYVDLVERFKGHEWGSDDQWITRMPACEGVPDWSHQQSNLHRTIDTSIEYLLIQLGLRDSSQISCLAIPAVHPTPKGQSAIASLVWFEIDKHLPR